MSISETIGLEGLPKLIHVELCHKKDLWLGKIFIIKSPLPKVLPILCSHSRSHSQRFSHFRSHLRVKVTPANHYLNEYQPTLLVLVVSLSSSSTSLQASVTRAPQMYSRCLYALSSKGHGYDSPDRNVRRTVHTIAWNEDTGLCGGSLRLY
jgi:hypothetical protein